MKSTLPKIGISSWLLVGATLLWLLLILITYLVHHPYYTKALSEFPNFSLAVFILAAGATAYTWIRFKTKKTKKTLLVNGLTIYGFVLFIQFGLLVLYQSKYDAFTTGAGIFQFLGYSILLHLSFFILVAVHYAIGQLFMSRLKFWYSEDSQKLLSIAIGISISGFVLVLLGMAGFLKPWLLWLLAFGILAWQRHPVLDFTKSMLLRPVSIKEDQHTWHIPVIGLLGIFSLLSIAAVKAYPVGFDGAGLYLNIAHLIAEYQALPSGGQAFYGSVFMSLGELLFGLEAASVMLSHFAIIFCLFALYRLGRLFLTRRYSWLAVLSFYLLPSVNFHSVIDEKIDLLFLFISLSSLLLLLEYRIKKAASEKSVSEPEEKSTGINELYLVWGAAGWLAGYAIGIKYLGVLSMCGLLVYLVYQKAGSRAGAGTLGLLTAVLFILGIHRFAYVSLGGTSQYTIAAIAGGLGLGLLAWGFSKQLGAVKPVLFRVFLFTIFAIIPFLPWAGKHLSENGSLSIKSLVQGVSPTPKILVGWDVQNSDDPLGSLLQVLSDRGVNLDADQKILAQRIVDGYAITGSPEEKRLQVYQLRDQIIETVLSTDQKLLTLGGATPQQEGDTAGMTADGKRGYQLMLDRFTERGVVLTAQQLKELQTLFSELNLQSVGIEQRKAISARLKEQALNEILSPQQLAVLEGKQREAGLSSSGEFYISGAQREEIKRYAGYEPGFPLYLSMPYDLTMNTNVPFAQYLDITFLFLVFLGLLCYSLSGLKQAVVLITMLFFWVFSVFSVVQTNGVADTKTVQAGIEAFFAEHPDAINSGLGMMYTSLQHASAGIARQLQGFYNFMAESTFLGNFLGVVFLTILIYFFLRERFAVLKPNFKGMLAYAFSMGFLWVLLGNGIVWYAFPVFGVLVLWFVYYLRSPEKLFIAEISGYTRYYLWSVLGLMLFLTTSLKFINTNNPVDSQNLLYAGPFLNYTGQESDREKIFRSFRPFMAETIATLNQETESRVFRVGTFFNYHIEENDRRVLEDNQLEQFAQISSQLSKPEDFLLVLKNNGFRYVLFDMNVHSIDRTPDRTLTAKAKELFDLLYQSPKAKLLQTDNIVKDPAGGSIKFGDQQIPGRAGFSQDVLYPGTFVLYELVE